MAQATKKKVVEKKQDKLVSLKTATPTKAIPAELTRGKDELTPAHVLTWINENAGGINTMSKLFQSIVLTSKRKNLFRLVIAEKPTVHGLLFITGTLEA